MSHQDKTEGYKLLLQTAQWTADGLRDSSVRMMMRASWMLAICAAAVGFVVGRQGAGVSAFWWWRAALVFFTLAAAFFVWAVCPISGSTSAGVWWDAWQWYSYT